MHQGNALYATGQVSRPRYGIRCGGIDFIEHRHLGSGQVFVPAELLQHGQRKLRISVLDLRTLWIRSVSEQADLYGCAVRLLLLAFDTESRTETPPAIHYREVGVV